MSPAETIALIVGAHAGGALVALVLLRITNPEAFRR
jgi:hypothetical protein